MNLIRKTNTYYLIFLALVFPLMLLADYLVIKYIVQMEVEEILLHESDRINFYLSRDGTMPPSDYLESVQPLKQGYLPQRQFRDSAIYDAYAGKQVPFRTYTFTSEDGREPLLITLKHVSVEINKMIWLLFITTSAVILLLGLGLYFINRKIYEWTWSPFFENLSKLKNYRVDQKSPVLVKRSKIDEFESLNEVIISLIDQVKKDFENLKEFNENISHEIQTPLAIIRNKVVLLMESKNLNDKELKLIEAVYQETNKLSKIGKSLTLISRIENQEFKRMDRVEVRAVIQNILSNMEEIIRFKNLRVTTGLNPVSIECDHILADILFTNLIKNAVQHNIEGGFISMTLKDGVFEITNSAAVNQLPSERMFRRFQKGSTAQDSLGLGLAINQKICEIYGFRLQHRQDEGTHTFSLFLDGDRSKQ